jgi:hypothetical protein
VIFMTDNLENIGIDTSFVRLRSVVPEYLHKVVFCTMAACTCTLHERDICEDNGNVIFVTGDLENIGIDTSFVRLRLVVPEYLHKVVFCTMAACTCTLHARDICEDNGNVTFVTGDLENMGIDTSFMRLRPVVPELLQKVVFCIMAAFTLHVAYM